MILRLTGRGTSYRPADTAELHLTVGSVNKTCALASQEANAKVARLEERLQAHGFSPKALKALSFDISPHYEETPEHRRTQDGYACRIALRFSLDFSPEALSSAVEALSEDAEELSIHLSIKDTEGARRDAVRAAWKDALSQANALAAASGLKVGEAKEASLDFGSPRTMNVLGAAALSARSAPLSFTPDDVRLEATLSVTFELN